MEVFHKERSNGEGKQGRAVLCWHPEVGDCRQELVFIGQKLERSRLVADLDDCLLTDAELTLGPRGLQRLPDPFPAWPAPTMPSA